MGNGELYDFLDGCRRRHRGAWERARLVGDIIARTSTGKPLDLPLPWDDDREEDTLPPEEFERLQTLARQIEQEYISTETT